MSRQALPDSRLSPGQMIQMDLRNDGTYLSQETVGMKYLLGFMLLLLIPYFSSAQGAASPQLAVGHLDETLRIDGIIDEAAWASAPVAKDLVTTEPVEGAVPSGQTLVRVLASTKALIIGVDCRYNDPDQIVSYSKLRDTDLRNEDHVRIVIDPFLDGQSGYIFGVNASGARYDALVSNRGESENEEWDAVWEAATSRHASGWSLEIRIPIQSISYKKELDRWAFNLERRIEHNQETIRWANAKVDQWFIQTSRAGYITNLPVFDYGLGLNIRPSLILNAEREGDETTQISLDPSVDLGIRLSPNVQATVTVNTDFAETEVDTRQTNLTRFPLFFPEKRAFFLEGSDIFEFGVGLSGRRSRQIVPFFSRRLGLYEGEQVPIQAGAKINGRIGNSGFGGLVARTRDFNYEENDFPGATMGLFRFRQNVLGESSVGVIGMFGDPQGRMGSYSGGGDFTFQTTRFRGDKNLIAGVWGLRTGRDDLPAPQYSYGVKVDYPNDLWDVSLTYIRIGEDFDPSLGFVSRTGIHFARVGATYAPRPRWSWLRQMRNQLFLTLYTDLTGEWESYSIFTAPINWRLESGDKVEFKFNPKGERLIEGFEIAEGVLIPEGSYHFIRYSLEADLAAKRKFNGKLEWKFGPFYGGSLHEFEARWNWNPSALLTFEISAMHNIGRLPFGDFDQTLVGTRVRFNVTPDLQLNSFFQYDTDSRELGVNARIHWIFDPQGDFFLVYNHNTFYRPSEQRFLGNQLLAKVRYNFRM
ncbi:MAG: carbohydrate binding family 9 domain-containing protein [Saprospiraceae bacterium]|nr:carbohydrate binding family 9 domain-containing protein [Saprospiraceae bacterium]